MRNWLYLEDGSPRWKDLATRRAALVTLVPLIYYATVIRWKFTFGDGPELLAAAYNMGNSHPSGYPLWTLLSWLPAHLPGISPYWNVSFALSAVPTAVAVLFIYLTTLELKVSWPVAMLAAWSWAANFHVIYLASRVEVYALHCMFLAITFYTFTRFAKGDGPRWAYLCVTAVCLGLTNHLTSAFLIAPVTIGLIIIDRKWFFTFKTIGRLLGISAACSSVYLYLPLQAMANHGDTVSWNDPQTLERFWFHVSGKEYSIFRDTSKIQQGLNQFVASLDARFFPGAIFLSLLGIWETWIRGRVVLFVLLLFVFSMVGYIVVYPINDIETYYTGIYVGVVILMALGGDWLASARLPEAKSGWGVTIAFTLCLVGLGSLMVRGYKNHYAEAVAQDMSEQVYAGVKQPAIIFSSVDGHSFPLWYQRFVNHPDDKFIPIDRVMYRLDNKLWYREWFRTWYPWVKWPSEAEFNRGTWEQWLIDHNPDVNFYAMLNSPWSGSNSHAVNRGWHFELMDGKWTDHRESASRMAKHIYTSTYKRFQKRSYMLESLTSYKRGEERIACVAEWLDHPGIVADWKFFGPNGEVVKFKPHEIPKGSNMSWEFLEKKDQTPGKWRCEVKAPKEPLLTVEFTIQ